MDKRHNEVIDPFDEVGTQNNPEVILSYQENQTSRLESFYGNFIISFKIIMILLFMIIMILVIVSPEKGIVIQPFESPEKNLSNTFIANHLFFELLDIKEINDKKIESSTFQFSDCGPSIPSFLLEANSIDYNIGQLGNIGAGGISLPLGQLSLLVKQLAGRFGYLTGYYGTPILTGSIQKSRSDLCIIAILNDPDPRRGIAAWEMVKNLPKNDHTGEKNIRMMVNDLAFQIATILIKENKTINPRKYPQTWEALENLTKSRNSYISYNITGNINDLNGSRDFALKAEKSEPCYSETSFLFSIIGSAYLKLNYSKEAEQAFENATKLNSSFAYPWNGLGLALFYQGRIEESIQAYKQATELNPNFADAWYNEGIAPYRMGEYNASVQAYAKAIELNSTINACAWCNKGSALLALNNTNDSIQAFDEAIKLNPKDAYAWNNKGIALTKERNFNDAIKAYEKAIDLNYLDEEAWYNKGSAYLALGQYNESIQAFDEALKLNPKDAYASYFKGIALEASRTNSKR